MTRHQIRIKRVYEPPDERDGTRILVDRLWPRGVARDRAQIARWLKDIAPSNTLRRLFHNDPAGWQEFKTAYYAELEQAAARPTVDELRKRLARGPVTLLFAARDETHNNAVALKEWLEQKERSTGC